MGLKKKHQLALYCIIAAAILPLRGMPSGHPATQACFSKLKTTVVQGPSQSQSELKLKTATHQITTSSWPNNQTPALFWLTHKGLGVHCRI